jgi:ferritin
VNQAHNLTQSYQNEVTKWRTHQFDNKTMISIINDYIPKYENLVNQSKTLQPPKQFQNATNVYTKSLESELQSNVHFKNYVSTNNSTENKLSSQFLQEAANHELDAFKALAPSGIFAFVPGR